MVPCNSDGVVIFGCMFAWGVCALFGQEHLPDAYFRIVWCIFRRHVDFQDVLPRKRWFVTKRSTKSQIAWNDDFRRGRGPGRTSQCRQRSNKNTIYLLESTRLTETLKGFDQGRFSTWKKSNKMTDLIQIFVERAPACKKSARAAQHLQHSNDFFEPCAPTATYKFSTMRSFDHLVKETAMIYKRVSKKMKKSEAFSYYRKRGSATYCG